MKKLYFIIGFLLYCFGSFAQFTSIPDNNFEQALIDAGIDSDGIINGQISASDAVGISTLDLNNKNISDLTGIEDFQNLLYLYCSQNNLTSLDVSNNNLLRTLNCADNNITSLDVSNLTLLNTFYCYQNNLTSLDITNNTGLVNFYCGENDLGNFDISNNTSLVNFDCSNTNRTSLDVSHLPNLRELRCQTNPGGMPNAFNYLDLSNNPNLEEIYCYNLGLDSINFSNCINLSKVLSHQNSLSTLDISDCILLDELLVSHNQLSSIDISNNPVLVSLSCSDNLLTQIDVSNNPLLEGLYCAYNQITNLDLNNNTALVRLACSNNLLESIYLGSQLFGVGQIGWDGLDCQNNMPYLVICGNLPNPIPNDWTKDPSATYSYNGCFPRAITGNIYIDANSNCTKDSLETSYAYSLVRISNATDTLFFNTDNLGNYHAALDTGIYTVEAFSLNGLWSPCTAAQPITVDTNYIIQEIDFGIQAAQSCEFMLVDIGAPFLRMTGGGSNYTVNYCNQGTLPAYNAYVEVELDTSLTVLTTSLPINSQNGNIYTFLLDTVQSLECGSFTITVLVDSNAILGETHCTEAHIYPDSVCGLNWAGPLFELTGNCDADSVYFTLTNVGTDMGTPINYFVFEDHLMRQSNSFSLEGGEALDVSHPVSIDKTYRFLTDPIPNFPSNLGDGFVTLALEGCSTSPSLIIDTSYVLNMYNGNSNPAIALDCQQNIFAYDPNDKAAQPAGYGTAHYIEKNTPLDYRIRFQNTGNDTAFTVVLKDTLSTYLDLTSLQMGTSSHPYTWNLNNNILTIRFDNIMLPDSNANEPASNGFVKYNINQVANLPLETRIENTAYIYFDYNPAIITNTTFHTIGENFYTIQLINVATHEEQLETTEYRIFPNPTQDLITIQQDQDLNFSLQLFNLNGQLLRNQTDLNGQYQFNLKDYPAGTYILKIQDEKQVNTYKIVKQ